MSETKGSAYPTQFWHRIDDLHVQCDLCPRYCRLQEGQRGLCFVRGCLEGEIKLFTWGRSSGFCIDPVEKKPLNHFYPGQSVLSFGTAGCNLTCKFCQNWDMSKSREMDRLSETASPERIALSATEHHCMGVAFTYNDPVVFMEYALDIADACHESNLKTIAVSAGYICDAPRPVFFSRMDAANIDLKSFNQRFYKKICGGDLAPVLDTLLYLRHETNIWLEITTLLIPGENDTHIELEALCRWVHDKLGPDVPIHFTAFHPDWKMLNTPPTTQKTLSAAREIALSNGLYYPYAGNVHDERGNSTYCCNCQALLIERDWYQLGYWGIDSEGRCKACRTPVHGRFEVSPGTWGRKRQIVKIADKKNP